MRMSNDAATAYPASMEQKVWWLLSPAQQVRLQQYYDAMVKMGATEDAANDHVETYALLMLVRNIRGKETAS